MVDAVGNDPTECRHVRVTAGTASLTVYTSIYPQLSVNALAGVSAWPEPSSEWFKAAAAGNLHLLWPVTATTA